MSRIEGKFIRFINPALDIILTGVAFIAAYHLKQYYMPVQLRGISMTPDYSLLMVLILGTWYLVFQSSGWVIPNDKVRLLRAVKNVLGGVLVGVLLVAFLMFIFRIVMVSRLMLGMFIILDVFLLVGAKLLLYQFLNAKDNYPNGTVNILIIGSRERARDVIRSSDADLWKKHRVVGCLETDREEVGKTVSPGVQVIGTVQELKNTLLEYVIDEIVFAIPLDRLDNANGSIALAEEMGIGVRIMPDWQLLRMDYRPRVANISYNQFNGTPTLLLSPVRTNESEIMIKYIFDYVIAASALLALFPVMMFVAAAIKIASPGGPVFFRQERCGFNGRKFMMYKFRTMVPDAEEKLKALMQYNESDGPAFKIKNDPRIIPFVGRLLRKTQLDELPQLFNILRGEMSFVGPRPLMPWIVDKFDLWHRRRMSVKPGLTCLWQIAPNRNDILFEDWMKLDLEYIDKWSIEQDLRIFARTFKAVFVGTGR